MSVTGIIGWQHHTPYPKFTWLSVQMSLDLGRDVIQKPTSAYTEETAAFRRASSMFSSFYFSFFIPYHPVFPPSSSFPMEKTAMAHKMPEAAVFLL